MAPSIVVVGSVDTGREYRPPLQGSQTGRQACQQLGRELRRCGFEVVAFSADPAFVEIDVVKGYVDDEPGKRRNRRGVVTIRGPRSRIAQFPWPQSISVSMRMEPDPTEEWEVSFYRSVLQADGLIVIGGGRSTRTAGVVAMSQRVPLVAVAAFGGGAALVWENLSKVRNDATTEDLDAMGRPWSDESARELVASLRHQAQRRLASMRDGGQTDRRAARIRGLRGLIGVVALGLAASGIVVAAPEKSAGFSLAVVLAAPVLAAIGGAMLRDAAETVRYPFWSAARGLGAGLMSSMLYVASQLLTTPDLLDHLDARRLLWFTIPLGMAAGTAFELIYDRLHRSRLLELAGLADPAAVLDQPPAPTDTSAKR
jgi:hypothetical protein